MNRPQMVPSSVDAVLTFFAIDDGGKGWIVRPRSRMVARPGFLANGADTRWLLQWPTAVRPQLTHHVPVDLDSATQVAATAHASSIYTMASKACVLERSFEANPESNLELGGHAPGGHALGGHAPRGRAWGGHAWGGHAAVPLTTLP
eukprot:COSAG04_NODE_1792_length_5569_cov_8.635649_7_plen_147_part_00